MGESTAGFGVTLRNASTLVAQCINANTLSITNAGGQCVQVWRLFANRITITGDGTVEVVLPARSLPSNIDVSLVPTPGASRLALAILVFSPLRADGERIERGAVTVNVTSRYASKKLEFFSGIVLFGCGVNKVNVILPDITGYQAVSLINYCTDVQADAQNMTRTMFNKPPCTLFI